MKNKIKKYKFHIFALSVTLLIASFDSCQHRAILETLKCPCRIMSKQETIRGKVVVMQNSDSVVVSILSDELYEKNIGDIVN